MNDALVDEDVVNGLDLTPASTSSEPPGTSNNLVVMTKADRKMLKDRVFEQLPKKETMKALKRFAEINFEEVKFGHFTAERCQDEFHRLLKSAVQSIRMREVESALMRCVDGQSDKVILKKALKAPKSAYMLFAAKRYSKIKAQNPEMQLIELQRLISAEWHKLTDKKKDKFKTKSKETNEAYKKALEELQLHTERLHAVTYVTDFDVYFQSHKDSFALKNPDLVTDALREQAQIKFDGLREKKKLKYGRQAEEKNKEMDEEFDKKKVVEKEEAAKSKGTKRSHSSTADDYTSSPIKKTKSISTIIYEKYNIPKAPKSGYLLFQSESRKNKKYQDPDGNVRLGDINYDWSELKDAKKEWHDRCEVLKTESKEAFKIAFPQMTPEEQADILSTVTV